jgi:hypothetical protein
VDWHSAQRSSFNLPPHLRALARRRKFDWRLALGSYTKPWNCVNQLGAGDVVLDMVDVGSVVLEANCLTVSGVEVCLVCG